MQPEDMNVTNIREQKSRYEIRMILLSICIIIHSCLQSQQNSLRFENLTGDVEFGGAFISKIQQDSKGYLWISSSNGLLKYDGYSVIKYQYNPFDVASVSQNRIYTFLIDKSDTIWLGTPEGLCKFDRGTEKFVRYQPGIIPNIPNLGNVSAIAEDDSGNLWIGNYEGELWRFDRKKHEFLSLTSKLTYEKHLSLSADFHDGIYYIFKSKNGGLWIGHTAGLFELIRATKSAEISFRLYENNPSDSNSLSDNEVNYIYEDSAGLLWIGTVNGGLNWLNRKTGKFTRYMVNPSNPFAISDNRMSPWGHAIVEDKNNDLWVSTFNGLNKLDRERKQFVSYFENPNSPHGLKSSIITTLGQDAGGNLFIGTVKGLHKLFLNQLAIGLLQHKPDDKNSLTSSEISSVVEDKSGNVWIGTATKGLNKWDKISGLVRHYLADPTKANALKSNEVGALLEDSSGNLWICNAEYLSVLRRETGVFEHFNSNSRNSDAPDAKAIFSIHMDPDGLIWLGTGNGIKNFNPVSKKFTHYYYEPGNPQGISDYTAVSIFPDSKGNIWVGTESIAFNKFDWRTGKFKHYKNNAFDSTSISSNMVKCVFEDSRGNLWIGTSAGGLCQYDYTNDRFITHTLRQNLPWSTVFAIQEDNSGNLWLGTEKGISCYFVSKKIFKNYDVNDGLQSNFFAAGFRQRGSSFKGKNGILYFGGDNGLNYFDPAQIKANIYVPPVVITQFKIFDKLQPGANEAKEIVLNYDQNFFSFEFAALHFTNTPKCQYAYRLENFDRDWIYSGSRRYAGYTNLDPGEYVFKVKGSNNDGIWNEEGSSIRLIILPPWWRTRWAYALYLLGIFLAIWGVHRYQRQRVIRSEREKAQKRELQQAKEIEKAYAELKSTQSQLIQSEKMASLGELTAGIAHEIQNPLNFINNFSEVNKELLVEMKEEIGKGNLEDAKEIANDLIDNEEKINHHGKRADAIVKGMLQHSRTSTGQKEPTDLNALVDEYVRLSYHGLRAKDKSFNATIQTDFDPSIGKINIIPQDIGRVLLNLLNNAFYSVTEKKKTFDTGYEPTVSITTRQITLGTESQKGALIALSDNGLGIPGKVRDKIFQPFFTTKPSGKGTGLGLSLSYDIITKGHGGQIELETKENEFAKFIIRLPG